MVGIFRKLETVRVVVLTVDDGFALYDWELRVPRVLDRDRMCECEDDGCLWWDIVLCSPARRTLPPRARPSSSGSSHWSSAAAAQSILILPVISIFPVSLTKIHMKWVEILQCMNRSVRYRKIMTKKNVNREILYTIIYTEFIGWLL